ncbi:hypothetical protein Bbelb_378610 [Branchiostoma belcheri]|nr:hypothetical protein Bbelb_378610 [Branchiostoma belcheri]
MSSSTTTRELKRVSELVDAQLRSSFDKMKEEFLVSVKRDIIDAIKAEMKAELDELKLSLNSELADLKRKVDEKDKTIEKLNARLAEVEDHADRNEQYSRKHCLMAFGIPPPPSAEKGKPEKCTDTFINFSKEHLDVAPDVSISYSFVVTMSQQVITGAPPGTAGPNDIYATDSVPEGVRSNAVPPTGNLGRPATDSVPEGVRSNAVPPTGNLAHGVQPATISYDILEYRLFYITVPHARTKRLQQSFLHYTIRLQ